MKKLPHPRWLLLVLCCTLAWWLFEGDEISAAGPSLRINLHSLGKPGQLTLTGTDIRITVPDGGTHSHTGPLVFRVRSGKLTVGNKHSFNKPVLVNGTGPLRLDPPGKSWPGSLEFSIKDGAIRVINRVAMEEYLPGVIAGELGNNWPRESLFVQAVAARTFALWTSRWRNKGPWHLTDTARDQVYKGYIPPDQPVAVAVAGTRGQILYGEGELLPAFYHSTCGGHTVKARNIYPAAPDIPALAGVPCTNCSRAKRLYRWQAGPFPVSRIRQLFGLPKTGKIKAIKRGGKDLPSGRWERVTLVTARGTESLSSKSFRRALNLKSTLIHGVTINSRGVTITGGGWGHGVGICQNGAVSLAKKQVPWQEIIAFYYPGIEIRRQW